MALFSQPFNEDFRLGQFSYDQAVLKSIGHEARKHLARLRPESIVNNKGKFYGTEDSVSTLQQVGQVVRELSSNTDQIRLPATLPEREALGQILTEAVYDKKNPIIFLAPSCPDYGKGENFYKNIQGGISPEALGAINAANCVDKLLSGTKFNYEIKILVADTEDDKPEIIAKCANGSVDKYKEECVNSVSAISECINPNKTRVTTFTDAFGNAFQEKQYAYEDCIRSLMDKDNVISSEVASVSQGRAQRHSQILGRPEENYELTVRYMAQYAALGNIGREILNPVIFINYETPNKAYLNAGAYKGIKLTDNDHSVIPVLGSVVKR